MLYKYQPVWSSIADLRYAAINRVLDCQADDPYVVQAIIRCATVLKIIFGYDDGRTVLRI